MFLLVKWKDLEFCCSIMNFDQIMPDIEDNQHGLSEHCLLKNILIPFFRSQKHADSSVCGSEIY